MQETKNKFYVLIGTYTKKIDPETKQPSNNFCSFSDGFFHELQEGRGLVDEETDEPILGINTHAYLENVDAQNGQAHLVITRNVGNGNNVQLFRRKVFFRNHFPNEVKQNGQTLEQFNEENQYAFIEDLGIVIFFGISSFADEYDAPVMERDAVRQQNWNKVLRLAGFENNLTASNSTQPNDEPGQL